MTAFWLSLITLIDPITLTDRMTSALPIVAPRVCIRGEGYNGTDETGPMIVFNGKDGGIYCGSGDAFRATGSKIEGVRLARVGTGSRAISFVAASKAERPGEIVIRDVLTCGLSDLRGGQPTDNWDTGLLIDGGNLTEPGAAGIRRVRMDNFRAASCLAESIILRNVTHVTGTGIQIDQGTANRVPQMLVENSRHVDLQVNIFGELRINGCDVVRIGGYVQQLYIDKSCKNVVVSGTVDKLTMERGAKAVNTWGMLGRQK